MITSCIIYEYTSNHSFKQHLKNDYFFFRTLKRVTTLPSSKCRPKLTLKCLPLSKLILLNRITEQTFIGVQYKNFEYPIWFIHYFYTISHQRAYYAALQLPCTLLNAKILGKTYIYLIYHSLKLLQYFLYCKIKKIYYIRSV